MFRKLIYFVSFILVLNMALVSGAKAADPNLVGLWPLNEGAGEIAIDMSGNGNDGAISNLNGGLGTDGSVWVDDPERDTVISFNGTADGAFVRAGDIPQMTLTNDFTWAFWAKHNADNTADNDIILGNRMDENAVDFVPRQFIKFTPTKFEWHMNGNGDDNMDYDDIPADVWLHHAVVKTGAELTYYRNGIKASSGTIAQPLDFPQPLYFGGDNESSEGENWAGLMSEVRVYNKALTKLEIMAVVEGVERLDMEIDFATEPPVIDGELDEVWARVKTQNFVPQGDPANASGSWKALYDSVNLYVIVDVTDDSLQNDSDGSWQDDSVELYFDGGNTKVNTPLSGDDHQYTFAWTTDEIQGTNIDGATEGIEHAQVDTDTGWRIEIKLPWLSLQDTMPQARDLIGIDCYYNDDDDGGDSREGKMLTFSTVEGWNDASQWGTAILAAEPPSPTIVWVSFHEADDVPAAGASGAGFTEAPDKEYTDLLTANGYDVTRYVTTNNPDPAVLNAADLVIISRSVASGGYQNDGATAWNSISAPMIIKQGWALRASRMGYTTGTSMEDITGDVTLTVNDTTHPIFAGIPLTDGTMDNPFAGIIVYPTDGTTVARGTSINIDPVNADGTVLATISAAGNGPVGGMVIGEWLPGAMLTHAGGAELDILAGHRLVFLSGAREAADISSETAGIYDLLPDGEQMFLNAVKYMIPVKPVDPGTEGLAASYTFGADAADSSGNGLDGTLLGDAHAADGVLVLDGEDDAVAIPGIGDGLTEFTFSMKVYPTADLVPLQFSGGINTDSWGGGVHFKLNYGNANVGVEGLGGGDVVGTSIIEPDMWTHLALTVSPTEVAVYVNGVKEGSRTGEAVPAVNVGAATIGAWNNSGTDVQREMTGMMDDVIIYNRALSEAEVLYLANN